jgi:hypothetical protein
MRYHAQKLTRSAIQASKEGNYISTSCPICLEDFTAAENLPPDEHPSLKPSHNRIKSHFSGCTSSARFMALRAPCACSPCLDPVHASNSSPFLLIDVTCNAGSLDLEDEPLLLDDQNDREPSAPLARASSTAQLVSRLALHRLASRASSGSEPLTPDAPLLPATPASARGLFGAMLVSHPLQLPCVAPLCAAKKPPSSLHLCSIITLTVCTSAASSHSPLLHHLTRRCCIA